MIPKEDNPATAYRNFQQNSENLFVGIDLGTSQSAIATSSGKLLNVASVVGFSKDLVAYKLVGKSVVFGNECFKNRMSLDLHFPLEKGVIEFHRNQKNASRQREAVSGFINHIISLIGRKEGQKLYVVVGAPARSTVNDRQAVVKAMEGLVDAVLVVSEPFLVAYGMSVFGFAIIIDIGAGTLDICRMHGAIPEEEDQQTFFTAGNQVDTKFFDLLKARIPNARIAQFRLKEIKEQHAFIGKKPSKIMTEFSVSGKLVSYDISKELYESVESILPNIIKTTRKMITEFDQEYQNLLKENIILAGCGSRIKGLDEVIARELSDLGEVKVRLTEDPIYAGAIGGLRLGQDMPVEEWVKL
ncbi:rod shape-determining protein [candidate division KSB1 bacterium]|nr:rod shape-determining protein [candidate division KSB1 bacterium]